MASDPAPASGALPLAKLTVLDLTLARAGPTCVRHLADWGANVIRIEAPGVGAEDITGSRDGPDFQNLHRNKRVLSLNLKHPDGRATFMRLVERADVIVENMRSTVKARLGIAWDDVRKVNPRIVYGSISGFGQTGPYAHRAGMDQIVQAMGGLMSVTGVPGQGPMRAGIAVADVTAGNLLALGIMMALYEREQTGVGRWVQTSLLESQIFMMDFQAARWLMKSEVPGQLGNDHPTVFPSGAFMASDGMLIMSGSGRVWDRLCDALEQPGWKQKEEWRTQAGRGRNRAEITALIADIIRKRPIAHWMEVFEEAGVPCGPIYSVDQVFADPQVKHLGIAAPVASPTLGTIHVVGSAINMSGVDKKVRTAAPGPGAHTDEILREIGLSAEDVAAMRSKGVI